MTGQKHPASRYPHLRFRRDWELSSDDQFRLGECEAIIAAISRMPLAPDEHASLLLASLVKGAQATTAIEGNTLSDSEVAAVAAGRSLPPSKQYQQREVANVLAAMNEILRDVTGDSLAPLISPELIRALHRRIGQDLGEHFDAIPGQLRSDERTVGPYRCPRHEDVPLLLQRLCEWLRAEFGFDSGRQSFRETIVQAIVTHVYLEWIHPFGDGNGRTGRMLEFFILLRAGNPDIASHILSNFYNLTRPEYYRQLDRAGRERDLSAFLAYAIQGYRDGLRETLATIQEGVFAMGWRTWIYERFAARPYRKKVVFKRQRDLALALPLDEVVPIDRIPVLTPEIARDYAGLSPRTVLRDLEALEEMKIVRREGGGYVADTMQLRHQMPRRRAE